MAVAAYNTPRRHSSRYVRPPKFRVLTCTNRRPSGRTPVRERMLSGDLSDDPTWKAETWKDCPAPIVRKGGACHELLLATFGIVPR